MSSNYQWQTPADEMLESLPPETREVVMLGATMTMLNANATICFHH